MSKPVTHSMEKSTDSDTTFFLILGALESILLFLSPVYSLQNIKMLLAQYMR